MEKKVFWGEADPDCGSRTLSAPLNCSFTDQRVWRKHGVADCVTQMERMAVVKPLSSFASLAKQQMLDNRTDASRNKPKKTEM